MTDNSTTRASGDPKHILVIGAGVNGLSTAHNLLAEGHSVVLAEKSSRIGGVWGAQQCLPRVQR